MTRNEFHINRCIQIAKNGLGSSRPNPTVGCVIVQDDKIISEGFTSPYGGSHAEVNAIHSVKNKHLLLDATLYVTLEPCSHHRKTPPCSDLIIKHNIPRVVIGCVDDNPEVAGKGIQKLKDSGCEVLVGVLEDECKDHHKRFFTFHNKKRPYIILKWAETSDGFIAPKEKDKQAPVWITNLYSRQLVHKWRAQEHAILIGTNTVIADNPSLTVRDWSGHNPIRVVLDRVNKLSKDNAVFDNHAETIVISENEIDYSKDLAIQICDVLFEKNIQSIIIEGGAQTLQTFIDENLWDEARVFYGTTEFKDGVKAPKLKNSSATMERRIQEDRLKIFLNN